MFLMAVVVARRSGIPLLCTLSPLFVVADTFQLPPQTGLAGQPSDLHRPISDRIKRPRCGSVQAPGTSM